MQAIVTQDPQRVYSLLISGQYPNPGPKNLTSILRIKAKSAVLMKFLISYITIHMRVVNEGFRVIHNIQLNLLLLLFLSDEEVSMMNST